MDGSPLRWKRSVSLSAAMNFGGTQEDLPAHVDKVFGTQLAFRAVDGEGGADAAAARRAARPQCTHLRSSHGTWVWFSEFERPDPRCYEPVQYGNRLAKHRGCALEREICCGLVDQQPG